MKRNDQTGPQSGFSIVELMVAVVIGIVVTLAALQIYSSADARRRSSGGVTGAQTEGNLALYMLDRDLRVAGNGFADAAQMGCTVNAYNSLRSPNTFTFPLQPVAITPSALPAGDSIAILYGNSTSMVATVQFTASGIETKKTRNRYGFFLGDIIVATAPGTPAECALFEVTGNTNADALSIDHNTSTYKNETTEADATPRFNKSGGITFAATEGNLLDLGPSPRRNVYRVNAGQLLVRDDLQSATDVPVADNVVSLKAQYWVDANNNNTIDASEWTTTAPSNWSQLKAVRTALLVRSSQYEKDPLAKLGAAPSWAGGSFVMANLDGSAGTTDPAGPTNWRNYRYRVYENVIPLINVIWGSTP
jgi:type IV pilus assembly protein PilW